MKNKVQQTKTFILLLTPLILGGLTVLFLFKNGGALTDRELSLITAVQFISSMWFGWVASQFFSEREFQEKQKKFAISAYRRIREVETNLDRLLNRLRLKLGQTLSVQPELDIIKEITLNLQTTIRSSKADWADIIGEEIKTLEEIEEVKNLEVTPDDQFSKRRKYLLEKLPASLEIQTREILSPGKSLEKNVEELIKELEVNGYVEFDGFWDSTFEKDIFSLPLGSKVFISIDDVGKRAGTLIAHTEAGETLGVITNKLVGTSSYFEFVNAVIRAFEKSKFVGEYSTKGSLSKSKGKGDEERHYFKIKVKKEAIQEVPR